MNKLYDVWEDDIIIKSFETLEEANKWCVDNYRGDYIIKDDKVYSIKHV